MSTIATTASSWYVFQTARVLYLLPDPLILSSFSSLSILKYPLLICGLLYTINKRLQPSSLMLLNRSRNIKDTSNPKKDKNVQNSSCRLCCNSESYSNFPKCNQSNIICPSSSNTSKSPEMGYFFTYPKLVTQKCYLGQTDEEHYQSNLQVMFGESEIHHILRLKLAQYNRTKNSNPGIGSMSVPKIGIPKRRVQLLRRRHRLFLSSGDSQIPFQPDFLSFEGVKKKYTPKEEVLYNLEHVRYLFPRHDEDHKTPPKYTLESVRYLFGEKESISSWFECLFEGFTEIFIPVGYRRKAEVVETVNLLNHTLRGVYDTFGIICPFESNFRVLTPVSKDLERKLIMDGYIHRFERESKLPSLPSPSVVDESSSNVSKYYASKTRFVLQLWKIYHESETERFESVMSGKKLEGIVQMEEMGKVENMQEKPDRATESGETAQERNYVEVFTLPLVTKLSRGKSKFDGETSLPSRSASMVKENNASGVTENPSQWKTKLGCKIEQLCHPKSRKGQKSS